MLAEATAQSTVHTTSALDDELNGNHLGNELQFLRLLHPLPIQKLIHGKL